MSNVITGKTYRDIVDTVIMWLEYQRGKQGDLWQFLNGPTNSYAPFAFTFCTLEQRRGVVRLALAGQMPDADLGVQTRRTLPIDITLEVFPAVATVNGEVVCADAVELPEYAYPEVIDELVTHHLSIGFFLKGYVMRRDDKEAWVEFICVVSLLKTNVVMQHGFRLPHDHDPSYTATQIDWVVEALNRQLVTGFATGTLARAIRERLRVEVLPHLLGRIGDVFKSKEIPEFNSGRLLRDMRKNAGTRPDWPIIMLGYVAKQENTGEAVRPLVGGRQRVIEVG